MKKLFITLALIASLGAAVPALAQAPTPFCTGQTCSYIPLERLPGQQSDPINSTQQFGDYVSSAFRMFIILGGMFAVGSFVFGGVAYMVSETLGKKDFARKQMQRSVYGLLLLLGSYLLLTTINPRFKVFDFNPGALGTNSTGTTQPNRSSNPIIISTPDVNAFIVECQNRGGGCNAGRNGSGAMECRGGSQCTN